MHAPELRLASEPSRRVVVGALGFTQTFGYGSTYYLPAVLAAPISSDTGWSLDWVIGGLSIGLLCGGFVSRPIGRAVDTYGGRPILALGSLSFAAGLAMLGLAAQLPVYLLGWCVIGIGMGAGLYDVAFATLGRRYGAQARGSISVVTLFGGFASTICWPLSTYLVTAVGWRWTCLAYAAVHLAIALPLHLRLIPRERRTTAGAEPAADPGALRGPDARRVLLLQVLVATSLTLAIGIVAIISVHLLALLQERGFSAAAAVAVGALIGPSQVAGRFAELALGRHVSPLWSALVSAVLMAAGLAILNFDVQLAALAVAVYAAGGGVSFIVRGTLPLALFGPVGFGTLMGRLAFPSLIGQALAPWLAVLLWTHFGLGALLPTLLALSVLNVLTVAAIFRLRPKTPGG